MNLHRMLLERQASGNPVTVGIVGAGKFGTMYLSQARWTAGLVQRFWLRWSSASA